MNDSQQATVGIAGHYDKGTRTGAWAVVIRLDGRETLLYGILGRAGTVHCERYGMQEAISALRRLRVPLRAIEVTYGVKRALMGAPSRSGKDGAWATARASWKSMGKGAGLRVTRKPGDTYTAALKMAEIAAISGFEKLRLTDQELDTPGNSKHKAEVAEQRAKRAATRAEREKLRRREEINEYAVATGRDSFPSHYRPRRRPATEPSWRPQHGRPVKPPTDEPANASRLTSVDELLAILDSVA